MSSVAPAVLFNAAPLSTARSPVPPTFNVPLFVRELVAPETALPPAPVSASVAPAGSVKAPLIVPPVHVVVPARFAVPLCVPDCSVRLVEVTVPLNVLLPVTRFEPAPVNC